MISFLVYLSNVLFLWTLTIRIQTIIKNNPEVLICHLTNQPTNQPITYELRNAQL